MLRLANGAISGPQAILFDLDGTLVDSVPDLAQAINQMLLALNLPLAGIDRVRGWVGNGATMLVRRALAGGWLDDQPDHAADDARLAQALPLFYHHYAACNGQATRLYPGVVDTLRALTQAGHSMALVTNKPAEFTHALLARLALAEYFRCVVSGDTLPQRKPDPAPLLHAMQALHATPDQTVMVGDSVHDIHAARRAGIAIVAVDYGYHYGNLDSLRAADRVISHLADLLG